MKWPRGGKRPATIRVRVIVIGLGLFGVGVFFGNRLTDAGAIVYAIEETQRVMAENLHQQNHVARMADSVLGMLNGEQ